MRDDEIHVWIVPANIAAAELDAAAEVLSDAERAKAARYRFADDRARSIVARSALRSLLAQHLRSDPRELRFVEGEHGKPELATGELHFNVSHSGDLVAIAIARTTPLGIDIEREREMRDRNALAQRFFATAEAEAVRNDPTRFFPIWTAKESVIKALGTGLAIDLRSFEAFAAPDEFRPVTNLDGWFVRALPVVAGYHAALAAGDPRCRVIVAGQIETVAC